MTEIVGFDYLLPVDTKTAQAQIEATLKLGLPEAIERKSLTIIANGPSAKDIDLGTLRGPTLALNGAMSLFTEKGLTPTYWAVCDPQEIVGEFLPENSPLETVYFVASKCHPSIFGKLKDRDVRVWHLMDHEIEGKSRISLACSVTISASWLMHRLGFTDFEYWGWDGCFMDGKHHAGTSEWPPTQVLHLNYGGSIKDGEVLGGRTFDTTRTWAAEAKAAEQFFQLAKYFDIGIKIHGDGMIEHMRSALMAA